ncbi:MAG: NADP-dependent oxidoreductase [Neomegalonema sp.]|nr:NADP-dependent oxidoreductase [Neomegalonema sp.]
MRNPSAILIERPKGVPTARHFAIEDRPLPSLEAGQLLVQAQAWSVDPAQRGWANDAPNYLPPVAIGDPMRGFAVGEVVESRRPDYRPGDIVSGMLGWSRFAVSDGSNLDGKFTYSDLPPSYALGVLGLTGVTAYFGLLEACAPETGETVVVSTAAGSVGATVGQIAKIKGCRTVGIAGGAEKARLCLEEFGYDAAIDYRAPGLIDAIDAACPNRVDCYFDNTCGAISDAVMTRLAKGARITICGTAAITDWDPLPQGPRVHRQLLAASARMTGFLAFDYADRRHEALDALAGWLREGKVKVREHWLNGAEAAPGAIELLYAGGNTGKLLIEL